ncbi:hypothetical protein MXB_284, partial [Myxobolus squamalis]
MKSNAITDETVYYGRAGSSGSLAFMSCYYKKRMDTENSDLLAKKVVDLYHCNLNYFENQRTSNEILYGRSGYLYSLLLLKRGTDFPIDILSDVCKLIINSGKNNLMSNNKNKILKYCWSKKMYLGALHGYCGILYMLLDPQWCHGAPGAIYLAIRTYKYYEIASKIANVIWKRGLLRKGIGLCHGVAGNGYSFLSIYNAKGEIKYLYYALM